MRLKDHLIALGEWDEEQQSAMDTECAERVKAATKEVWQVAGFRHADFRMRYYWRSGGDGRIWIASSP